MLVNVKNTLPIPTDPQSASDSKFSDLRGCLSEILSLSQKCIASLESDDLKLLTKDANIAAGVLYHIKNHAQRLEKRMKTSLTDQNAKTCLEALHSTSDERLQAFAYSRRLVNPLMDISEDAANVLSLLEKTSSSTERIENLISITDGLGRYCKQRFPINPHKAGEKDVTIERILFDKSDKESTIFETFYNILENDRETLNKFFWFMRPIKSAEAFSTSMENKKLGQNAIQYAVLHNDKVVGCIRSFDAGWLPSGFQEVESWIEKNERGKGIAPIARRKFFDIHLKENQPLSGFASFIEHDNERSRAAVRSRHLQPNGAFIGGEAMYMAYSMDQSRWRAHRLTL